MDALSDILSVVGLTGGVFLDAELTAPWAVAGKVSPEACRPFMVQPQQVVGFHYVLEGSFELLLDGGTVARVEAGEAIMLPRNDLHVFGSSVKLPVVSVAELLRPPNGIGISKIVHGGGGPRTRLICGFMGGNDHLERLLMSLPPFLKLKVADLPGGDWMDSTFTYAAMTSAQAEPGASTVLAKVSEVLFVESLRRYLANLPAEETGWLAALRDPVIGRALALLHGDLHAKWTSETLAREVNMSRSVFAERFTQVVGQPPMRYLTSWRMQLARKSLAETNQRISEIAYEVGYTSEAAFTRAFTREHGTSPVAWRRRSRHETDGDAKH